MNSAIDGLRDVFGPRFLTVAIAAAAIFVSVALWFGDDLHDKDYWHANLPPAESDRLVTPSNPASVPLRMPRETTASQHPTQLTENRPEDYPAFDPSKAIVPPVDLVPYRHMDVFEPQETPRLSKIRKRAQRGDVQAMFELGRRYMLGQGMPSDPKVAETWFRKSGSDIDKLTSHESAYLKLHGFGTKQDLRAAYYALIRSVRNAEDHDVHFSFASHVLDYLSGTASSE